MNKKFTGTFRVYHEATDAQGVVYHGSYLDFMCRNRCDWLRELPVTENYLESATNFFVVRHLEIDYLKPARLSAMLEVSCEVVKVGKSSLVLRQEIRNSENLDELFTASLITLVNINDKFQPKRLDEEFLAAIKSYIILPKNNYKL